MANPLSPISCSRANIEPLQPNVQHFHESIAWNSAHREETCYDGEEFVPSSPFEADAGSLQNIQHGSSDFQSVCKMNAKPSSPIKTPSRNHGEQQRKRDPSPQSDDKENQSKGGLASLKSSIGFDPDDTCASAFSMVPTADMTRFARLGESPIKVTPSRVMTPPQSKGPETMTPTSRTRTPGTLTRPLWEASPTPRRQRGEDSTTQLLDFTEQLANQGSRYSPRKLMVGPSSQSRDATNLLDFDLPPAPTPRSVPTMSSREVESMKASFQSQISSLTATINGKEATIHSLIEAKNDAERRVGVAAQELRESEDAKKILLEEREEWERRETEVKSILRDVKSELVHREKERDDLSVRLEGSEKMREESEVRAREAEAKIAGLEMNLRSATNHDNQALECSKTPNKAIEIAVEKVARELHQLYKQKHETKVTALKKSYEGRWEKKVRDLEDRLNDLGKENEELKNGREATMTKVVLGMMPRGETADVATSPRRDLPEAPTIVDSMAPLVEMEKTQAEATAKIQTLNARSESLEQELQHSKDESFRLQGELDNSRAENSNLVAMVEEMLQLEPNATVSTLQLTEAPIATMEVENQRRDQSTHACTGSQNGQFRTSSSEHAGAIRPPSRSGLAAPKVSGLARPGFGLGGAGRGFGRPASSGVRSGIMSSIERMGRGRTGDGQ